MTTITLQFYGRQQGMANRYGISVPEMTNGMFRWA